MARKVMNPYNRQLTEFHLRTVLGGFKVLGMIVKRSGRIR